MDIAPAAAAAFANASVHERIGPSLRFGRTSAASAFIGLLEERIGKGILFALRKGEQYCGDRQGALVELEHAATQTAVHQDSNATPASDTCRSRYLHIMRCIGDRDAGGFGFTAMEDAIVAMGKRVRLEMLIS